VYALPSSEEEEEEGEYGDDDDGQEFVRAHAQRAVALRRSELSPEERQWRAGIRGAPPRAIAAAGALARLALH
jgi:hypothetical protein